MTPIGTVSPLSASPLTRIEQAQHPLEMPAPAGLSTAPGAVPTDSFGALLDNLVGGVTAKQQAAVAATNEVLMGNSGQLHQSVIAMQESSVAFGLMVEVRNKLVESYQELMRMQV
jgi:flagellar hook-basal body complex protein FliE